jgi:hypothetical protein
MSAAPLLSYLSDCVNRIITPPVSPTTDSGEKGFDGRLPHDFWLSCVEKGIAVPPTAIKVKPLVSTGFKGQAPR